MAVSALYTKCSWCEEEAVFNGPDPEQEAQEAGWFQVTEYQDYPNLDFCSVGCAISWFPS